MDLVKSNDTLAVWLLIYNILANSDHKNRWILENFKMCSKNLFNQITYFCIWIGSITTFHQNRKKKEHTKKMTPKTFGFGHTLPHSKWKKLTLDLPAPTPLPNGTVVVNWGPTASTYRTHHSTTPDVNSDQYPYHLHFSATECVALLSIYIWWNQSSLSIIHIF